MSKTTNYFVYGNKIYYPSKNQANVPNALDTFDTQRLFTWKFVAGSKDFGRDLSTIQSFAREKNERNYFYYNSAHSFNRINKEQEFKNYMIELLIDIGLFSIDDLPGNATDFDKEVWAQIESCLKFTNSKGDELGTYISILVEAQCCSADPDKSDWYSSGARNIDTIPPKGFDWNDSSAITVLSQQVSDIIKELKTAAAAAAAKNRPKNCDKIRYRIKGTCRRNSNGAPCSQPGIIYQNCPSNEPVEGE